MRLLKIIDREHVALHLGHPALRALVGVYGGVGEVVKRRWTIDLACDIQRRTGVEFPSPALAGDYGGLLTPRPYQRRTVDHIVRHERCFVLNGMGTGKTAAALWAFEWLKAHGLASRMLVLTPVSTMRFVWMDEAASVTPKLAAGLAHGSVRKRREAFENEDLDIVISNHDMPRLHTPEYVAKGFDFILIDEATAYKTWSSGSAPKRYKNVFKMCKMVPRVCLMTGTPTPNGPVDAWAMIRLVDPAFDIGKIVWENMTTRQVSKFKRVPRDDAARTVAAYMRPAIRVTTKDALASLKEPVYMTREPNLSKEQKQALKDLRAEAMAELRGTEIKADTAAVLILKLLQVSSGGVKSGESDEDVVELDMHERLNDIMAVVNESERKVIVFANFRHTVRRITEFLKDKMGEGYAAFVMGGVSQTARNKIFNDFQDPDSDLRVLVAHPATASHGLTLTQATTVLWVGPPLRTELYEQGNARAVRSGQSSVVTIVHQLTTKEERRIFDALRNRGDLQAAVLDMVKEDYT